jgi:hypothetical protein
VRYCLELRHSEVLYFRHVFEDLIRNIYRIGDNYYLQDANQIYYEILMSFSKLRNLPCSKSLNSSFLENFEAIYQAYNWLLKRIDLRSSQLIIPSIPKFIAIIKRLLIAIKKVA